MWVLLYASCHLFVTHSAAGIVYAMPALMLMALGVIVLEMNAPIYVLLGLLVLFILANTLYVYAATRHMLKKPESIDFLGAMRWRKNHTDFLLFISGGLMVLVLLALYFADVVSIMTDKADELLSEQIVTTRLPAINSTLLFGSRIAAVVFLFTALMVWKYLCRIGIRMPAHTDGYYLRVEEALSLTRTHALKITALSLLFITAISAITDAVTAIPALTAAAKGEATTLTGYYPITLPIAYFVTIQLHLGMWVELYKNTTAGYFMNKVAF